MPTFDFSELRELADNLLRPGALEELGLLAACLIAAWVVVWSVGGRHRREHSVLFGDHILDGLLFPLVALGFAFVARYGLQGHVKPAVFRVAIPVLLSLVVIRFVVRVLTRGFPNVPWMRTIGTSVSWLAWIGVALWLTGILPVMLGAAEDVRWTIGKSTVTLRGVIEGAFTAALVLLVAVWISGVLEKRLLRDQVGSNLSLRKIAATLIRSLLLFVGLMFALSAVGIDLTALSVFGGAIGVGLGFGLQKIASNYVSGFVILAERSVRIGDMVRVDGFEGRITDIRTRYTVVRSLGGREAIVPNETLITTKVENATLADSRVVVQTAVQVAYGTDLRALQAKLLEVVQAVPRVLDDPVPSVQVDAFAADGINLNVNFWIGDAENGQNNVKSDVNLAILDCLNALGVEIPFPQRVVQARISRDRSPDDAATPSSGASARPA